jgi:dimeric dUTPase (all-alpha-NTP-PPase superfamily)
MDCNLEKMFKLRNEFISEMRSARLGSYPELPLDLSKKKSQQFCRDLALRGVEEMFEALQHLKNWKPHRMTEFNEAPDREEFLEEIVDALNYFFSLLIASGFNEEDLYDSYVKKHEIIMNRLKEGY